METHLMDEKQLKTISPAALSYLGDAVYELAVREHLLLNGAGKVNNLHLNAVAYVRAERQAQLFHQIESMLDDEELTIFRRARNTKGSHQPPQASGLEALVGFWYLRQNKQRLQQIFSILFAHENKEA